MHRWSVSNGQDGYAVELTKVPPYLPVAEAIGDALLTLTRHRICCHMPDWTWKVPLGRPHYWADDPDDPPFLENSLGGALYEIGSWLSTPMWRREKRLLRLPITEEQAATLAPDFVTWIQETFSDDEELPEAASTP